MAIPGLSRSINSVGISHPGLYAFNECMPDVEAAIISWVQVDNFAWGLITWMREQQELNRCCIGTE